MSLSKNGVSPKRLTMVLIGWSVGTTTFGQTMTNPSSTDLSYDNLYHTTLHDSATCVVVHHSCASHNYINACACFNNAVLLLVLQVWRLEAYKEVSLKEMPKYCLSNRLSMMRVIFTNHANGLQYFGLSFSSAWLHGLRRAMEPAKWIVKAQACKLLLLSYQFCKGFA